MADRLAARLGDPRLGWVLLALAMAGASAAILYAGRGIGITGDGVFYFGRIVEDPDTVVSAFGLEYLLAPHNDHLQFGGKVVYETLFAIFGTDFVPFRVAALAGVLAGVGLFFELARTRVGVPVALAVSVAILLCGAAWEVMLWPFDLHTTYALAFGLGAVLVTDRAGRRADPLACVLLVASVSMIEVGLAFVVAFAVWIISAREPLKRLWVPGLPAVLYGFWWVWARSFEPDQTELSNIVNAPQAIAESLVAVSAALTGAYAHGAGVFAGTLDPTPVAVGVAVVIAAALALGFLRAWSPIALAFAAVLLVYWVSIAIGDRYEDSSRYVWVGAILLCLLAAELARGLELASKPGLPIALAVIAVTAIAFEPGRQKIADGRKLMLDETRRVRIAHAMTELGAPSAVAATPGDPVQFYDLRRLPVAAYELARQRIGSLGLSLDEVRALGPAYGGVADAGLAQVLELRLAPSGAPAGARGCSRAGPDGAHELPPGGARFRPLGSSPVELWLARFAGETPSVPLGELAPGRWAKLRIPIDRAPEPWLAFASAAVRVCPLR